MNPLLRYKNKLPWILVIGFTLMTGVTAWIHSKQFSFVCDDAYITFRYAQNLARHGALEWNIGERVEGYTNFLWAVILAVAMKLGFHAPSAALVLGRVFGALGVGLMTLLLASLHRDETRGEHPLQLLHPGVHLGAFLVASTGAYACWSSGGLETAMFTCLSLGAFVLYVHEERSSATLRGSGAVMALAAMTRPEGALLFAWMGIHRLGFSLMEWRRRFRGANPEHPEPEGNGDGTPVPEGPKEAVWAAFLRILKRESLWTAGFVVLYGAYFLWRYHYFGYLFPNTYYIKASSPDPHKTWALGWKYLETFVRDYSLKTFIWVPLLGLAMSTAQALRKKGSHLPLFAWTYALGATCALGAVVVKVGGDFMAMHRFWVPTVPLLAFMAADTLRQVGTQLRERLPLPRHRQALSWGLCGVLAIVAVWGLARRSKKLGEKSLETLTVTRWGYHGSYDGMESVAYMDRFARDRVLIGGWLKERVPKGSWMAVGGAGAIVFASELNAIDSFGLSDLYVAHEVKARSSRPGHQKLAPMSYILSRKPDIICTPHVTKMMDREYRPPRRTRRRWERHGYQYFCATPKGLEPSHYCCLMRVDKNLGLHPVSAYRY